MWLFQRYKPIQWNRGSSHREFETPGISKKKCSQCKEEPAVGSVMMGGKFVVVGRNCKKIMRLDEKT